MQQIVTLGPHPIPPYHDPLISTIVLEPTNPSVPFLFYTAHRPPNTTIFPHQHSCPRANPPTHLQDLQQPSLHIQLEVTSRFQPLTLRSSVAPLLRGWMYDPKVVCMYMKVDNIRNNKTLMYYTSLLLQFSFLFLPVRSFCRTHQLDTHLGRQGPVGYSSDQTF